MATVVRGLREALLLFL
ncbi:hypothetical protein AMK25_12070, partial [Micromonospora sp. TSRI0369]